MKQWLCLTFGLILTTVAWCATKTVSLKNGETCCLEDDVAYKTSANGEVYTITTNGKEVNAHFMIKHSVTLILDNCRICHDPATNPSYAFDLSTKDITLNLQIRGSNSISIKHYYSLPFAAPAVYSTTNATLCFSKAANASDDSELFIRSRTNKEAAYPPIH